jgi:hypothetical protein
MAKKKKGLQPACLVVSLSALDPCAGFAKLSRVQGPPKLLTLRALLTQAWRGFIKVGRAK